MLTYIAAFIFYTLAMIGVMLLGFVVYKKMIMPKQETKGMIKILDKTAISPKKSLMVVKIKNEKFLIALDAERTTFLSKLNEEKQILKEQKEEKVILQNPQIPQKATYVDELQQQRLDKIQRQFQQLYSNNEEQKVQQHTDRKEMIRKLLKELNDTTTSAKFGSY